LLELLTWIEASALGQAVRGAGVWSYAAISLAHILGVATLLGSVLALDLKLLGLFPRAPLAIMSVSTVPLAFIGFALAIVSGACLLATNATEYAGNPFLLVKFGAIAVGLVNVAVAQRLSAWQTRWTNPPSPRQKTHLAWVGGVSLVAWITAAAAGRMIGYW
jgi:hypothetical protein